MCECKRAWHTCSLHSQIGAAVDGIGFSVHAALARVATLIQGGVKIKCVALVRTLSAAVLTRGWTVVADEVAVPAREVFVAIVALRAHICASAVRLHALSV